MFPIRLATNIYQNPKLITFYLHKKYKHSIYSITMNYLIKLSSRNLLFQFGIQNKF